MAINRLAILGEVDRFLKEGRTEDAISQLGLIIEANPNDFPTCLRVAELCVKAGDVPRATALWFRMAEAHAQEGYLWRGVHVLRIARRLCPTHREVAHKLADFFLRSDDPENAIVSHLVVAEHLERVGRFSEARQEYRSAAALLPIWKLRQKELKKER